MPGPKVPKVLRDPLYRAHEREIAKKTPKQKPVKTQKKEGK